MSNAFGVVSFGGNNVNVEGLQDYRALGAISFLGRYRLIDFPLSNMTNSGIDNIQLFVNENPRSIVGHVGTGRHYNINSKRGELNVLFSDEGTNSIYNHDIAAFNANRAEIEDMPQKYVVIATNYMVYSIDYNDVIDAHVNSGADITMVYKTVDNAKDEFIGCDTLVLNRQKGVSTIEKNRGNYKTRNISLESYVMSKEMFLALIDQAVNTSSLYTMSDMLNDACTFLDVRGYEYTGYLAAINTFENYYKANMELLNNADLRKQLFKNDWPVYTKTNDSCPTRYSANGSAVASFVSNGCTIHGTVENSIIGRGVIIGEGSVIKNCIFCPDTVIGDGVTMEYVVSDKHVTVANVKEVCGSADKVAYIKRNDKI